MELNVGVKQTMALSPQMLQSMEILQMGALELQKYIENLIQENPVVELDEETACQEEYRQIKRKLDWIESTDTQNRLFYKSDNEGHDGGQYPLSAEAFDDDENLYRFVRSQLHMLDLGHDALLAAEYVVECLDSGGYFKENEVELAAAIGVSAEKMSEAISAVQSLEPAGVGARSLAECLILQLKRQSIVDPVAVNIISNHLDALGKGRYHFIAAKLGVKPQDVSDAYARIRRLNPYPGSGYSTGESRVYINPDILVKKMGDSFEVVANESDLPALGINGYYIGLFDDSSEKELREYLAEKIRQAKWVIKSIEQRESTILNCAKCILEAQEDFFRFGPGHLKPLSLADIAKKMGVHESTVSRTLRNKYIQCSLGVFPMNFFFSRALDALSSGDSHSPDQARQMLKGIIESEDTAKPLSDRSISELMKKNGISISRRTVAKYRGELGIPGTAVRKTCV